MQVAVMKARKAAKIAKRHEEGEEKEKNVFSWRSLAFFAADQNVLDVGCGVWDFQMIIEDGQRSVRPGVR